MVVVVVIAVVVVGNTPQRVWLRIVVFPVFAFFAFYTGCWNLRAELIAFIVCFNRFKKVLTPKTHPDSPPVSMPRLLLVVDFAELD